jgi:hypothetical protein
MIASSQTSGPISAAVQRIYDQVVFDLTAAERLQLIDLLTQGAATPEPTGEAAAAAIIDPPLATLPPLPGWHISERRGGQTDWRDRAL